MTRVSRVVFSLCFVLVLASAGSAPVSSEDASRVQRIQELLDLTGAGDLGIQVMHGMIEPMKQALPSVPDEWWREFMAKVEPEDLTDLVIPIYERRFSDEEIDAMLEFYRTSVGASIISKMPLVMQESMAAGQAWGEDLAREILQDLKADGFELPPGV